MSNRDDYISLISCLPSAERLFLAKLPPLSRLKLEQRLKALSPHHRDTLSQIESVLDWRMQNTDVSNIEFLARANKVYKELNSKTLRKIVRDKLELRTCIAAMRYRASGQNAPNHKQWGFGRWVEHINRYWNEPNFNLENVFPWIANAQQLILMKDAEGLERFVMEQAFKRLQRFSGQHYFDFEAVVIYVLKWDIVDRATRHNVEAAKRRFSQLVDQGIGTHTDSLFEEKI